MTSSHGPNSSPRSNPYRALPSVSAVLEELQGVLLAPVLVTQIAREELDLARSQIQEGLPIAADQVLERCRARIRTFEESRFQAAINGTGIVLHTNLGRSPVSLETASAMAAAARSYLPLEIDPETNQRGGRMDEISRSMRLLTGAESTLVVNNNAGAILLALAGSSAGQEVIISRGEAVEIGGGVRIPEVVQQSGCRLVEVGTTNRTYARDFDRAIGRETAALLKVHTSNFRIEGFATSVSTAELGLLAAEKQLLLIEDLGSGALLDTATFGLRHEPTVGEAIAAGASVVTLSGDKLLGGPQAGIIAGRHELVSRIERHPLARPLRADKTTLAGVAATLHHYIRGDAERAIPIWNMIGASVDELTERARQISLRVGGEVIFSTASVGGGSLPGETLPSMALQFATPHPDALAKELRTGRPRVFPIIRDDSVLIDLRTVQPDQDAILADAIGAALALST